MSTLQVLNLRENIKYREKSQSQKEQARNRQKSYLKDVLVQNFMKRFNQRMSQQHQIQHSLYLQRIVGQEIEEFLQREQMSQKNLANFEKRLESKLQADPKIQDCLLPEGQVDRALLKDRRNTSAFVETNAQSSLQLPKIQQSITPTRNIPMGSSMYHKNKLNQLRKSHIQQMKQSSGVYGFSQGKQQQQSMQNLTLENNKYTNGSNDNQLHSTRVHQSMHLNPLNSERQKNSDTRSFADLRIKLGQRKREDEEDLPSNLDGEEWAEILKYEQEKFEEEKKREKEEYQKKRQQIRETLDRQLRERNQQRQKEIEERKAFESELLQAVKEKEMFEKQKQEEMKQKNYEQKQMRDWQLEEAKQRKEEEYKRQRQAELQFVEKLKEEITDEKKTILDKKRKEREICQKIIADNEIYKVKQIKEKELARLKENQAIEEYNKLLELQEKKRQEEWQNREQRIQKFMSKMADTVVRKNNEQEKELEKQVMKYQLEKEERDRLKEMKQKEMKRKLNQEIVQTLDQQIKEKKQHHKHEEQVKEEYMKQWVQMTEADAKKRQEEENKKKQQQNQLQDFLLMQMGETKAENGVPSVLSGSKKKTKQQVVGGPMSAEELRLNKKLLMEISKKKREKMGQSQTDTDSLHQQF